MTPDIRKAINDCITGRKPWPLLLTGGVGTGKTLAGLCLLDACPGGIYAALSEMCEDVQTCMKGEMWDTGSHGGKVNTRQYWYRWRECTVSVLDEIGARKEVSDHHYDCLKRAVDGREGKPCVFITNCDLQRISTLYDDRIASRLGQGNTLIMPDDPTDDRRLSQQEF